MTEHAPRTPNGIPFSAFETAALNSFTSVMITERGSEGRGHEIVFVNEAFTDMTGYSFDEVQGRTPEFMQGPKSDRQVLDRLRENMKRGEAFHGMTTNYKKDGTEFTIEWKVIPIRNEAGAVTHHAAVQRDVTSSVPGPSA